MYDRKTASHHLTILALCGIVAALLPAARADIRLPSIIGDNMVLQAGEVVRIWGWADKGEEIAVTVSWRSAGWTIQAGDDGKWMFKTAAPEAGGPYEMTLKGKNTVAVKNILAGEVWVGSGQSNMQMAVRSAANAEQEIAAATYPKIRLFSVERKVAETPQDNCVGKWVECSPQTVGDFSAAAYYFGRELHKELNVPIGLIHTSWGGTPAESWASPAMIEENAIFEPIVARFKEAVANYPKAKKEYDAKLEQWKKDAEKAKADGTKTPARPSEPLGPSSPWAPAGLYNAMVAPLIPYTIRGAIWYQGESNAGRAYQYRELFPAMIKSWWKAWPLGNFPFLYVQLANYMQAKEEPGESNWAELREAQSMTLDLADTGMAVIIDIGEANDIHPKNKQDVGKRLALWALARTYDKNVVYSGPLYKSMDNKDGKIILHFDHIGGGLVAKDGGPLKGFAIAGQDHKFVWADTKIEGDVVVVGSDKITEPVAVRYAWADNPVCNLYNKAGLPASPFRTDTWPGATVNSK
jgi:sialate O-acetylesterase